MIQLDCGVIETYHCVKVPKKGKASKPIILLGMDDMEHLRVTTIQAIVLLSNIRVSNLKYGQCTKGQSVIQERLRVAVKFHFLCTAES